MVTSTRARPVVIRTRIGSGPNAENIGQNTPRLQRGDIELGNASGQGVDTLARAHAERAQDVGEAARQLGEAG